MTRYDGSTLAVRPTLAISGVRAYVFQVLLIGAAVLLPLIAHLAEAPVRYLLPMHWPILLAGLTYGWRSGAVAGLMAPLVSFALTGFPLPAVLPSMTMELLTYGLLAGALRERSFSPIVAIAIALVAGRVVFIISAVFTYTAITDQLAYFQAALLPGFVAGVGQIFLLPICADWWIGQESKK